MKVDARPATRGQAHARTDPRDQCRLVEHQILGVRDRGRPIALARGSWGGRENAKQALRHKLIEHNSRSPATATTRPRSRTGAGPRRAPEGRGKIESKLPRVAKCSSATLLRNGIRGRGGIK